MQLEPRECLLCNTTFQPNRSTQVYCPDCRAHHLNEIRRNRERLRKKLANKNPWEKIKSVDEILLEKDIYNRKHGTHYTYGQYVMKLENGWLKGE